MFEFLVAGPFKPIISLLPFIVVFVVAAAIYRLFLPQIKGWLGERAINMRIKRFLDSTDYHLIPDVTLSTPDGTTQIDHIVVSRFGVFVIETKNYKGWIYGGERDSKWTQVIFRRKHRFQNPLHQNYKHTKTLSSQTGIQHDHFKSIVVFVGNSTFKNAMPDNVVDTRSLINYIQSFQAPIYDEQQVTDIVALIHEKAGVVTRQQKRQHVKNLHLNKQPVDAEGKAPVCPNCGKTMLLRTNRQTNNQFWGCPSYPKCRGMKKCVEK